MSLDGALYSPDSLPEAYIVERLRLAYRPEVTLSEEESIQRQGQHPLKAAAVLIPFLQQEDAWHLLFTRRTWRVAHHKGQVSFPGGACERGDTGAEETALRETEEEIGLKPADVRLLGRLNDVITVTRYRVTPVVGVIPWPYDFQVNPAEVKRVFTIPLRWLAERAHWEERPFLPKKGARPVNVVVYQPYDGEVVWGISARIVQALVTCLF